VRAELPAVLEAAAVAAWRRRWPDVVEAAPLAPEQGEHAHRRLGRVVARRLQRAQHQVLAAGRSLDADTDATAVHQLRKDARQLRYLLECFAELAPGREVRFVEHLKAFQAVLGHHQDLVVQAAILRRLATGPDVDELVEHLERAQDAARTAFADRFAEFDTKRARRHFARLVAEVGARPR
jgi:CHAD domain-containing protein